MIEFKLHVTLNAYKMLNDMYLCDVGDVVYQFNQRELTKLDLLIPIDEGILTIRLNEERFDSKINECLIEVEKLPNLINSQFYMDYCVKQILKCFFDKLNKGLVFSSVVTIDRYSNINPNSLLDEMWYDLPTELKHSISVNLQEKLNIIRKRGKKIESISK